jgi:secondary thiamine-phosphate synthase enzyme
VRLARCGPYNLAPQIAKVPGAPAVSAVRGGRGEIGRRAGFRCRWASALGGSSPSARILSEPRAGETGLEPATSGFGDRRTTSCATPLGRVIVWTAGHRILVVRAHTVYRTFDTKCRRAFIRITDDVADAVRESAIEEGMALVCAMHITAGVWVNDDEPGIQADALEWLDKLAPPSWQEPANEVARELLPDPGDYRHHRRGEDNGDAHLKNLLVHHQVIVPVTEGRLDLGPWQQIFYCEFDGGRPKRMVIKVLGE